MRVKKDVQMGALHELSIYILFYHTSVSAMCCVISLRKKEDAISAVFETLFNKLFEKEAAQN